jgi:acetolactate synthase I/II/III large subunit
LALAVAARAEEFLAAAPASLVPARWAAERLGALRTTLRRAGDGRVEPRVAGTSAAAFFAALRRAMPREAMLVTDTGLHQVLTRRHFEVYSPGGLLFPSDFQSMGFGLPAAIAARLAAPDRPVVALVGDGSMAINGLELATARSLGICLPVLVFVDGRLNQIRLHQQSDYGHDSGVALPPLDFHALADAVGVEYRVVGADPGADLAWALSLGGPSLLAVPVGDSVGMVRTRVARRSKDAVAGLLGARLRNVLKGLVRRNR